MPCAGRPVAPRTKLRQQQVDVAARGRELRLQQHAGEERAEEAARARPGRRLRRSSACSAGRLGARRSSRATGEYAGAERRSAASAARSPQRPDAARASVSGDRARDAAAGSTTRCARPSCRTTGAGPEPAELQGGQVEVRGPRIAGVEHLEAAVDDEAVDPLGAQPPTGVRRRPRARARRSPAAARRTAADSPARPAPTTTTSARDGGGTGTEPRRSRRGRHERRRPVDNAGGRSAATVLRSPA